MADVSLKQSFKFFKERREILRGSADIVREMHQALENIGLDINTLSLADMTEDNTFDAFNYIRVLNHYVSFNNAFLAVNNFSLEQVTNVRNHVL